MSDYGVEIAIVDIFLFLLGFLAIGWWRKGGAWARYSPWGDGFNNWRRLPLTTRYNRGQFMSMGIGYAGIAGAFIALTLAYLLENPDGSESGASTIIIALMIIYLLSCFALCLTVALFKWPEFLVPPWARDGKKRNLGSERSVSTRTT